MKSETMELHKKKLPIKVSCGIITLSDSLSKDSEGKEKDLSGQYIIDQVSEKYDADYYEIIPDDAQILLDTLEDMIEKGADAIFTTGGTRKFRDLEKFSEQSHMRNWELDHFYQELLREFIKKHLSSQCRAHQMLLKWVWALLSAN